MPATLSGAEGPLEQSTQNVAFVKVAQSFQAFTLLLLCSLVSLGLLSNGVLRVQVHGEALAKSNVHSWELNTVMYLPLIQETDVKNSFLDLI